MSARYHEGAGAAEVGGGDAARSSSAPPAANSSRVGSGATCGDEGHEASGSRPTSRAGGRSSCASQGATGWWRAPLLGSSQQASATSRRRLDARRAELGRLGRSVERIEARLAEARSRVVREDERMRTLIRRRHYRCTGFAFATFNTELAAARCLELLNSPQVVHSAKSASRGELSAALHGNGAGRLKAERPPEPEEVYWDQLQFKEHELVKRQFAAIGLLMLVALAGTAVITFANYGMGALAECVEVA